MKKRLLSLLEIMIVIFLITLVTGAIGYNMKGTLDKGKVFRTEQAKEQLHDLLLVCLDEYMDGEKISNEPKDYLKKSGIAKNPDKLILDGWSQPFSIRYEKGDFQIESENLKKYNKNQK